MTPDAGRPTVEDIGKQAQEGINVSDLARLLKHYFQSGRSDQEKKDYRGSKRPMKKLRDEIAPVSRFLCHQCRAGRVCFPQDNDIPDAWFCPEGEDLMVGIEVTSTLGRAGNAVMEHLNENGFAHDFPLMLLPNSASSEEFSHARESPGEMVSSEQWGEALKQSIIERIREKATKADYSGMILLVTARLGGLPAEIWDDIEGELSEAARDTGFSEIHVIDVEGQEFGSRCLK